MESLDDSGGEILAEAGGPVGKGDRAGPWVDDGVRAGAQHDGGWCP
jgi:hypothetical protein